MLNISPSKDELKHLEKIVAELTQRGYDKTVLFMKKANKNSSKCNCFTPKI
jgi:hypothetical protein